MPPDTRESRPDGDRAAFRSEVGATSSSLESVAPLGGLDAVAAAVDGAFVVVVAVTGGKYKRRCYLTAKAAEDAARRATDRGENATVFLAELKPLWKIRGGELR